MHEGFKIRRFSLGGNFEFHHSRGSSGTSDPFTIVRGGPEVKWSNSTITLSLSGAVMLNRENYSLTDFGDIAGHGLGKSSVSARVAFEL